MSYSYIKSVFPNFQPDKDTTTPIFNELPKLIKPQKAEKDPLAYNEEELAQFVKNLLANQNSSSQNINNPTAPSSVTNLQYYNKPAPMEYITQNQQPVEHPYVSPKSYVETFVDGDNNCDNYTSHILKCNKCKGILVKQWNIENDKRKNEDIMEIITYIIFGILILLLLDNLKK